MEHRVACLTLMHLATYFHVKLFYFYTWKFKNVNQWFAKMMCLNQLSLSENAHL